MSFGTASASKHCMLRSVATAIVMLLTAPFAQAQPTVGRAILFVHGICDTAASWGSIETTVINYVNALQPSLYTNPVPWTIYYDTNSRNVKAWPNGQDFLSTVPSSTRFFSMNFFDPSSTNFSSIDPVNVAQVSILNKADELAHVIQAITTLTHVKDVIVIAHSQGGLDARAYIEKLAISTSGGACSDQNGYSCLTMARTYYTQDINKLITLDTPHSGAESANWASWLPNASIACWAQDTLNRRELQDTSLVIGELTGNVSNPPPGLTLASIQSYTSPGFAPSGGPDGDEVVTFQEQSIQALAPSVSNYYDIPDYFGPYSTFYLYPNTVVAPLHLLTVLGAQPVTVNTLEVEIDKTLLHGSAAQTTSITVQADAGVSYSLAGPTALSGTGQNTFYSVPVGTYTLTYPGGSLKQTLGVDHSTGNNNWNLTFTIPSGSQTGPTVLDDFTSNATGIVNGLCSPPPQITAFSVSSPQVWVYFDVSGSHAGDSVQAKFIRPDGVVYTALSWSVISPGQNGYQCFSGQIPIAGSSAASYPGNWSIQTFWNQANTALFTLSFTVSAASSGITVLDDLTSNATGIVNGTCSTPARVSSFNTTSSKVWLYFDVTGASAGDSAQMKFFRPDGVIYTTLNSAVSSVGQNGYQCFSYQIPISGAPAASYTGTWAIQVFWDLANTPLFSLNFTLSASGGTAPAISTGGVLNGASYAIGSAVAPGTIVSVFGNFLINSPSTALSVPWPTSMAGVSMTFGNGIAAPLNYVSSGQVSLVVPWELSGQSQTSLVAAVNGQTSTPQTITLAQYSPGIFSMNAQGTGQGAIVDAVSGQVVDSSNPATPGSTYLAIYCTGLGPVTNQPASGAAATSEPLSQTATTPTVTVGGVPAQVLFAGLAPGFVGLYQIDVAVPAGVATGNAVPVVVSIGGATSNTVTIAAAPSSPNQNVTIKSLTLTTNSVVGGSSVTGTVTLSGPAPAGGVTVSLSSNNPGLAQVPAPPTLSVAAGQSSATFTITTTTVTASQTANITATLGNSSMTQILTISAGGSAATLLSVTGDCYSQGALNSYFSFGVYWIQASAYYDVNIDIAVTTGFDGTPGDGTPVSAYLTNSFVAGTTVSNEFAHTTFVIPPGSSANSLVRVFTGLVLPAGQYFLTLYAPTQRMAGGWCVSTGMPTVSSAAEVTEKYTYTLNGYNTYPPAGGFLDYWGAAQFSITGVSGAPPATNVTVKSLVLSSASVAGGTSVTGTVTLSAPAPAGGVQIALSSSNQVAQFPRSLMIPAGQNTGTFSITTTTVTSAQTTTISASLGTSAVTAILTVAPGGSTSLLGKSFTVDGTLSIGGQNIGIEIQAITAGGNSYLVELGQLSNFFPVGLVLAFDDITPTGSGNTITFSGPTVASIYTNGGSIVTINSATLTFTFTAPTKGSSVTGTLSFPSSGGTTQGTIAGTLTVVD